MIRLPTLGMTDEEASDFVVTLRNYFKITDPKALLIGPDPLYPGKVAVHTAGRWTVDDTTDVLLFAAGYHAHQIRAARPDSLPTSEEL